MRYRYYPRCYVDAVAYDVRRTRVKSHYDVNCNRIIIDMIDLMWVEVRQN